MASATFITGNQRKTAYLAKYLGHPVAHEKLDLNEIQSLDVHEIVRHKVRQAYEKAGKPVLVEDVALEFMALGRLPGPFIKWFMEEMPAQEICDLLKGKDRSAVARCVFGHFDGQTETYFEGSLAGKIAKRPMGDNGFGWDCIFIPEGFGVTRAMLREEDDKKTYLQIKPFAELKKFLDTK